METGAEYITGADSSCLMHMQGIIEREHLTIRMIHVVEILASQLLVPSMQKLPKNSWKIR